MLRYNRFVVGTSSLYNNIEVKSEKMKKLYHANINQKKSKSEDFREKKITRDRRDVT